MSEDLVAKEDPSQHVNCGRRILMTLWNLDFHVSTVQMPHHHSRRTHGPLPRPSGDRAPHGAALRERMPTAHTQLDSLDDPRGCRVFPVTSAAGHSPGVASNGKWNRATEDWPAKLLIPITGSQSQSETPEPASAANQPQQRMPMSKAPISARRRRQISDEHDDSARRPVHHLLWLVMGCSCTAVPLLLPLDGYEWKMPAALN